MTTYDHTTTYFRDVLLEFRISLAGRRDMTKPKNWRHLTDLIRQRSPEQVNRMERSQGLVK